ncbi:MAG: hypothetical protein IPK52_27355 [Chloroflexi bacterium]|nr:hypothetical protein [Chloroflexota bacterium]
MLSTSSSPTLWCWGMGLVPASVTAVTSGAGNGHDRHRQRRDRYVHPASIWTCWQERYPDHHMTPKWSTPGREWRHPDQHRHCGCKQPPGRHGSVRWRNPTISDLKSANRKHSSRVVATSLAVTGDTQYTAADDLAIGETATCHVHSRIPGGTYPLTITDRLPDVRKSSVRV